MIDIMRFIAILVILSLVSQQCVGQFDCFGEGVPRIPDVRTVAKGADDFGLKLFTDIATTYERNSIVLSPYSVWSVLNLAYFGAGGQTAQQLRAALGVPNKGDAFLGSNVIETSLNLDKGTTFRKADKAYFANDIMLRNCALQKVTNIEKVNFKNSKAAAKKINGDIEEVTQGKIKDFLSPGIIKNSRFILVNAVYFKGNWTFPFPVALTTEKPFYDESRTSNISTAKMMSVQAKLRYFDSEALGAAFLELPYENSDISMIIILPTFRKATVNSVLQKLTSDVLDNVAANMKITQTRVILPRFKMTTRIADELKVGLANLGVTDLFDATKIDLTSFVPNASVVVDQSLHHATIEVSEEGTVAAAATGLIGTRSGVGGSVNFNADRPFVFLIRDMSQGITLFAGVLRNPKHTTAF